MLTKSIDMDLLLALVIGSCCLMLIVYLDRYFKRRNSVIANARYTQHLHEGRKDSRLYRFGSENRARKQAAWPADLIIEPEVEARKPGFFSRRPVVTDTVGRVVATHYEELVLNDLYSVSPQLLLTSGNA